MRKFNIRRSVGAVFLSSQSNDIVLAPIVHSQLSISIVMGVHDYGLAEEKAE